MNPDSFFENFSLLAETPNGIQKLREMILQMAVQGKLVPQNPDDEPAEVLLEMIRVEMVRLAKDGIIKKSANLPSVEVDEIAYEIPDNWYWTRLGTIGIINPKNNVSDDLDVSFIPMTLLSEKYGDDVVYDTRSWKEIKKGYTHFAENDVVVAKITPCFQNGKSAVMKGLKNGVGAGTTELYVFRSITEYTYPYYVLLYFRSPQFIQKGITKTTGTANQKRIPRDYFLQNPFPLPPLEEQKRIVAKVDQLMELCDQLESLQQQKQESRIHLNNAALNKMLETGSPEEFAENWRLVCDNFGLLYDNLENVEKLRQAILQLAVMGKLVEQDDRDEPAEVLLEKIRDEKEKLVKEGEIRNSKPLPSIEKEENPFELPHNWKWERLGNLVSLLGDGLHGTPNYSEHGDYFFINGNNLKNGKIIVKSNTKTVSLEEFNKHKKSLNENTVLVSINGTLGNVAFYNNEKVILGKSACYFNLLGNLDKFYIKILIETGYFLDYAFENATGSTIKNVSLKSMRLFLVPLPPLEEQKRIVAKVDQLMELCDQLESNIRQAQEDGERLMEAAVNDLLE
ncbi:restriction endonuclease subunit S [Methanolobus sp. WCC4]|uniref:restriction endonuclease subunit S n=1 Tax=Methanolobus sp. WCC4 TaxID=3125784 RepID=UPI0030F751D6